jgi:methyl-accepting chemotaxis protein
LLPHLLQSPREQKSAAQVLQASGELSRQSETMRGKVEAFLSNIKAA